MLASKLAQSLGPLAWQFCCWTTLDKLDEEEGSQADSILSELLGMTEVTCYVNTHTC